MYRFNSNGLCKLQHLRVYIIEFSNQHVYDWSFLARQQQTKTRIYEITQLIASLERSRVALTLMDCVTPG